MYLDRFSYYTSIFLRLASEILGPTQLPAGFPETHTPTKMM